ncbi:MAG: nitrate reductase molybdenum cofactor assembly chaperone [Salinivirgaceae bacterium]|jgi:nitrate reductase delta subunit
MLKTYKILSLLLSYPDAQLQAFLRESESELKAESLLPTERIEGINCFVNQFVNKDLTDWQAEYVQLFDYSRSASLHLFEHIKGDSKDRGQAMVDMLEFYRENGMELTTNELPDYIPAFLEFLSTLPAEKAAGFLAEPVHIIQRVFLALKEKDNPYYHILAAVVSLSAKEPDIMATETVIKNEKPMDLDAEYDEEPIEFGSNNTCVNCKK